MARFYNARPMRFLPPRAAALIPLTSVLALLLAPSRSAAQAEAKDAPPVFIKLEAEDFGGVAHYTVNDPNVAWKPRMAWYPQWSRGGDSGWWAAYGEAKAASGEIALEQFVPRDGTYTLWVRYEDYAGKPEPFDVLVIGAGGEAKAEFGRVDVGPAPAAPFPWAYAWDKKTVDLKKG